MTQPNQVVYASALDVLEDDWLLELAKMYIYDDGNGLSYAERAVLAQVDFGPGASDARR